MSKTLLRLDSSARLEGSQSRALAKRLTKRLSSPDTRIIVRDLAANPLPAVDAAWIEANFSPDDQRTPVQRAILSQSDALIEELEAADIIIIGVPIYNFGVPSGLKAWIDLVARARRTFRYTDAGPEGLLVGKRAILIVASGGTKADSEMDFATPYMRHALGFLGIHDVEVVAADQLMIQAEHSIAVAHAEIERLAA
ncbi:MAG: NAD(P)H-dependent oxidoreductase [Pseudomonadota bacterium]